MNTLIEQVYFLFIDCMWGQHRKKCVSTNWDQKEKIPKFSNWIACGNQSPAGFLACPLTYEWHAMCTCVHKGGVWSRTPSGLLHQALFFFWSFLFLLASFVHFHLSLPHAALGVPLIFCIMRCCKNGSRGECQDGPRRKLICWTKVQHLSSFLWGALSDLGYFFFSAVLDQHTRLSCHCL